MYYRDSKRYFCSLNVIFSTRPSFQFFLSLRSSAVRCLSLMPCHFFLFVWIRVSKEVKSELNWDRESRETPNSKGKPDESLKNKSAVRMVLANARKLKDDDTNKVMYLKPGPDLWIKEESCKLKRRIQTTQREWWQNDNSEGADYTQNISSIPGLTDPGGGTN